jgi:hypothetical protein
MYEGHRNRPFTRCGGHAFNIAGPEVPAPKFRENLSAYSLIVSSSFLAETPSPSSFPRSKTQVTTGHRDRKMRKLVAIVVEGSNIYRILRLSQMVRAQ